MIFVSRSVRPSGRKSKIFAGSLNIASSITRTHANAFLGRLPGVRYMGVARSRRSKTNSSIGSGGRGNSWRTAP